MIKNHTTSHIQMQVHQAPKQRKSLPSRGFETNVLKWLDQKVQRDSQLWSGSHDQSRNYWIVQNKYYDLTDFIKSHPGGPSWLRLTQGQDITQHFILHHLDQQKARKSLQKYYVKDCPNNVQRFTFNQDGFYRTVKRKILSKYSKAYLQDQTQSRILGVTSVTLFFSVVLLAGYTQSYLLAMLAGFLLTGIFGLGHNFIHHKDNILFRNCIFLASGMTAKDYQIMHCLSHHIYPNTELDFQNGSLQPYVYFLRSRPKNSKYAQLFVQLNFTFIQPLNFILKTVVFPIIRRTKPKFIYALPLSFIILFYMFSGDLWSAFCLYLIMYTTFGTWFMKVLLCGHRQQQLWNEGAPKIEDYGEHTVLATSDTDPNFTGFLSYFLFAGFNIHMAHHFFPTADHARLKQITEVIRQTCKERGIKYTFMNRLQCALSVSRGLRQRKQFSFK